MSNVLSYLDCGCAITNDGRVWCPSCSSPQATPEDQHEMQEMRKGAGVMNIEQMQHGVKMALELQEFGATVTFSKNEFSTLLRAATIGLQAAKGCIGVGGTAFHIPNHEQWARYILEGKS
jgi:hypothetical protein